MATISETVRPPRTSVGVLGWLKENLFSTWYNALLTFGSLGLIYVVLRGIITWALTGARWDVVTTNLTLFLIGPFPRDQVWRVWACVIVVILLGGLSLVAWGPLGRRFKTARRWVVIGWLLSFPLTIVLLHGFGGNSVLPAVGTSYWGGLLLTFLLAIVGIVASFPLGVLLALGRRSGLPVVRWFCTLYIELIRGVPLVTVLFMAAIMLPLFLPEGVRVDKVLRAMVGFTLFTAAYIAENVRGGLAAVPLGQYEAARAVGLSGVQVMALIVLPQALRAVIPPIVGQFISLFKDTSLVVIIGLLDLLNIAKSVVAQPQFMGLKREVYLFVAVIYFIFSYAMSYASRRLEVALGVGER
ncbi:MAG: amino acid ABC transporter permease [Chloroflexi bacterium]|nr:amino acid ABC transporter permease [Chloroflexota bacterium]